MIYTHIKTSSSPKREGSFKERKFSMQAVLGKINFFFLKGMDMYVKRMEGRMKG